MTDADVAAAEAAPATSTTTRKHAHLAKEVLPRPTHTPPPPDVAHMPRNALAHHSFPPI